MVAWESTDTQDQQSSRVLLLERPFAPPPMIQYAAPTGTCRTIILYDGLSAVASQAVVNLAASFSPLGLSICLLRHNIDEHLLNSLNSCIPTFSIMLHPY